MLRQVGGVGPIVALAYVLTLEDPGRFRKSRAVGAYLGLVPSRSQSGDSDPQLRITKEGDHFCAGFWFSRRSTSSGHSSHTATSDDPAWRCQPEESAMRRNGRSLPSHENSRCCCIGCGGPRRSTSRYARPSAPHGTAAAA